MCVVPYGSVLLRMRHTHLFQVYFAFSFGYAIDIRALARNQKKNHRIDLIDFVLFGMMCVP